VTGSGGKSVIGRFGPRDAARLGTGRIGGGGQQEAAFRDQAIGGQQPQHPVKADAVAERTRGRQGIFVPEAGPPDLFGGKGSVTGRSGARHRCRSLHPPRRRPWRTGRRSGPGRASGGRGRSRPARCRVDPAQFQPHPTRAHAVLGEFGAEPVQQASSPAITSDCRPIGSGRVIRTPKCGGIGFGETGSGLRAERLIQPQHQPLPKAPGEGCAGQGIRSAIRARPTRASASAVS
jgi:hypothetical protein